MTALWNWETCLPVTKRRHVAALQVAAAFVCLFTFAAASFADSETATNLSPAQIEGRVLAHEILTQRPDKDFTADGKLKLRTADGQRGEVALHFATLVSSDTNWTTTYAVTGVTNGAQLTVTHHGGGANEYAFSEAGKNSKPSGAKVMTPFAGSDFWLADLGLEFFHWPEQSVLKSEHRRSRNCRVLISVNPLPTADGYSRVESWIDRESSGLLHADAYDAGGKLLKEFEPKEITKVNGQYQLQEMEIRNVQKKSRTTIVFKLAE
ncbi:MAG: Outer rane lipoproteinsorting protein [Verrucomicrobiota bacterium]